MSVEIALVESLASMNGSVVKDVQSLVVGQFKSLKRKLEDLSGTYV